MHKYVVISRLVLYNFADLYCVAVNIVAVRDFNFDYIHLLEQLIFDSKVILIASPYRRTKMK